MKATAAMADRVERDTRGFICFSWFTGVAETVVPASPTDIATTGRAREVEWEKWRCGSQT